MMQSEFEQRVCMRVDPECYRRIEEVYMNCQAIRDKDHIAKIYTKFDMHGIETIYKTVKGFASLAEMKNAVRYLKVR